MVFNQHCACDIYLIIPNFLLLLCMLLKLFKSFSKLHPDPFFLSGSADGKDVGWGYDHAGLCYLKNSLASITCQRAISSFQIHYHLSHPSLESLRKLVPNLSHLSSLECDSCQLANHHQETFPRKDNKRCSIHILIYSYIWRPCCRHPFENLGIFFTLLDGYSSITCLCLLNEHLKSLSIVVFVLEWRKLNLYAYSNSMKL